MLDIHAVPTILLYSSGQLVDDFTCAGTSGPRVSSPRSPPSTVVGFYEIPCQVFLAGGYWVHSLISGPKVGAIYNFLVLFFDQQAQR